MFEYFLFLFQHTENKIEVASNNAQVIVNIKHTVGLYRVVVNYIHAGNGKPPIITIYSTPIVIVVFGPSLKAL